MSRRSEERRRRAFIGEAFELGCLFAIGFLISSFIGLVVAWALGVTNHAGHGHG